MPNIPDIRSNTIVCQSLAVCGFYMSVILNMSHPWSLRKLYLFSKECHPYFWSVILPRYMLQHMLCKYILPSIFVLNLIEK